MARFTPDFSLEVGAVKGVCPAGENWARQKMLEKRIPVLSCEGPCIRGEIARLAANMVAKETAYARTCYAEVALVPHSSMAQWVREAEKIIMIDGCFLSCVGRIIKNLVDERRIVHIDALPLHQKYGDIFSMDDVPETERKEVARWVADRILEMPRGAEPQAVGSGESTLSSGQRI
jgi:uncharacterized metal-binding protein